MGVFPGLFLCSGTVLGFNGASSLWCFLSEIGLIMRVPSGSLFRPHYGLFLGE